MTREQEIGIIINYLKKEVIQTGNLYPDSLIDIIIRNAKLIEAYRLELQQFKNK